MKSKIDITEKAMFNSRKLMDYNEPVLPAPITLTVAPTFWQKVWRAIFK